MARDEPSELEICQNLLDSWIDSLEELSELSAQDWENRPDTDGEDDET